MESKYLNSIETLVDALNALFESPYYNVNKVDIKFEVKTFQFETDPIDNEMFITPTLESRLFRIRDGVETTMVGQKSTFDRLSKESEEAHYKRFYINIINHLLLCEDSDAKTALDIIPKVRTIKSLLNGR